MVAWKKLHSVIKELNTLSMDKFGELLDITVLTNSTLLSKPAISSALSEFDNLSLCVNFEGFTDVQLANAPKSSYYFKRTS